MKTMRIKLMFLVIILQAGCYGQPSINLENTVWTNNKMDDCTSKLQFRDSGECMIYYCGLDETFSGKYYVKSDTIVIEEYHLKSEMPGSTGEKEIRFVFKYLLDENILKMFYFQDLKYDYTQEGFDESYQFTRTQ